jgi:hypothetical protein
LWITKGNLLIIYIPVLGTLARKLRVKIVIVELEVSTLARKLRIRIALIKLVLEELEVKIDLKIEKLKKEINK